MDTFESTVDPRGPTWIRGGPIFWRIKCWNRGYPAIRPFWATFVQPLWRFPVSLRRDMGDANHRRPPWMNGDPREPEAVSYSDDVTMTSSQMTCECHCCHDSAREVPFSWSKFKAGWYWFESGTEIRGQRFHFWIYRYVWSSWFRNHYLVKHHVDTADAKPIYQRLCRAEFKKRAVIEREVNKMLECQ